MTHSHMGKQRAKQRQAKTSQHRRSRPPTQQTRRNDDDLMATRRLDDDGDDGEGNTVAETWGGTEEAGMPAGKHTPTLLTEAPTDPLNDTVRLNPAQALWADTDATATATATTTARLTTEADNDDDHVGFANTDRNGGEEHQLSKTQRLWQQPASTDTDHNGGGSDNDDGDDDKNGNANDDGAEGGANSARGGDLQRTRRLRFHDTLTQEYEYDNGSTCTDDAAARDDSAQAPAADADANKPATTSSIAALWQSRATPATTTATAARDTEGTKPRTAASSSSAKTLWATASRKAAVLSTTLAGFSKRLEERLDELTRDQAALDAMTRHPLPEMMDDDDHIQEVVSAVTREILDQGLVTDGAIQSVFDHHIARNPHIDRTKLFPELRELAEQLGVSLSLDAYDGDKGVETDRPDENGDDENDNHDANADHDDDDDDDNDGDDADAGHDAEGGQGDTTADSGRDGVEQAIDPPALGAGGATGESNMSQPEEPTYGNDPAPTEDAATA